MTRKKSKLWTFVFSAFPGAGQMFMGFMKQGISIMSIFFAIIFLSSWLRIGPLIFVIPVLWFYAFFDGINKMSMSDEEFAAQEDFYVLSLDKMFESQNLFFKKRNLFAGIVLVILGTYLLWSNILDRLANVLAPEIYHVIVILNNMFPQLAIGVIILVIGIKLIVGKSKESAR